MKKRNYKYIVIKKGSLQRNIGRFFSIMLMLCVSVSFLLPSMTGDYGYAEKRRITGTEDSIDSVREYIGGYLLSKDKREGIDVYKLSEQRTEKTAEIFNGAPVFISDCLGDGNEGWHRVVFRDDTNVCEIGKDGHIKLEKLNDGLCSQYEKLEKDLGLEYDGLDIKIEDDGMDLAEDELDAPTYLVGYINEDDFNFEKVGEDGNSDLKEVGQNEEAKKEESNKVVVKTKKRGQRSLKAKKLKKKSKKKSKKKKSRKSSTKKTAAMSDIKSFPSSYRKPLTELSKKHPNWRFVPVKTGLNWKDAFEKMVFNPRVNTIYSSFGPAYKSVEEGCYNYLKDYYNPCDGINFVSASDQAVAYYMDPRNWLDEGGIFLFRSNTYSESCSTSMVQKACKGNKVLRKKSSAKSFIKAGRMHNINPIYLASRAYEEIGDNVVMVDGSKKYYNPFNIGASDSANGGASSAIKYAKKKKWTSLDKAICEGAAFMRGGFVNNGQYTPYLEHFNVNNGIYAVGTHVYMTAVYAPANQAYRISNSYEEAGLMDEGLEFHIPVFEKMPKSFARKPSSMLDVDNNYYLKSLYVKYSGRSKRFISPKKLCYETDFSIRVPSSTKKMRIGASGAGKNGSIVAGAKYRNVKKGRNVFRVTCRSGSGQRRVYRITVTR